LRTQFARSSASKAREAVRELRAQLGAEEFGVILFYCSTHYDLESLAREFHQTFPGMVVGCTASGLMSPLGHQKEGIVALGMSSPKLSFRPYLIDHLENCQTRAFEVAHRIQAERDRSKRAFGLLLVDGLSLLEELLVATLYKSIDALPLVGGSAGDDLKFERSLVYYNGQFHQSAAVLLLVETNLPFTIFKFQHFVPTNKKLVITGAIPEKRIVTEINGEPAVQAYAEIIGHPVEDLNFNIFSQNPLLLKINDEYYGRSIQKANPDGSMTLYCAIEEGIVLTVGACVDKFKVSHQAFLSLQSDQKKPSVVLGFDCILRRLEIENGQESEQVETMYSQYKVFGFNTYGEQMNAIHMNQTFTGVALGEEPDVNS
jgi:hypothetical protein